jgi:hypothetical protein
MSESPAFLLKSKQVSPLPIGPGGNSDIKNQMNNTNTQLTLLSAQATANTMYDPPAPKPVTEQLIQGFCSSSDPPALPQWIMAAGIILIVYGVLAK